MSVHRAFEAVEAIQAEGSSAGVLDLRTVSPLDRTAVCEAVEQTGRLLVVDEDYEGFGLSGELAALVLEAGLSCKYARDLEDRSLPNRERICTAARRLME